MREKEPKKEDRRVRRTKKMLTQALTTLLGQKQISEITVKELTELADINRGTFYLYYRDVYDMLTRIEDELFAAFDEIVDPEELAGLENGTLTQGAILVDVFEFVKENQEMCRVLLSTNGDMNFLHRLNDVLREKFRRIWQNMPSRSKDEFAYHYSFLVFGCAGMLREWVSQGCPESPQHMAELAESMIRQAI